MRSFFRNSCIMVLVVAALVLAGCGKRPPAADAEALKEKKIIVAKVNGAGITKHALTVMTNRMAALNSKTPSPATPAETRQKALDQLIFQELSVQEATRQGLHVTGTEIESAISALVGHKTEDVEKLQERLNMTGAELRSEITRRILLQRIYVREVAEKISVTDDDVRKEYERRRDEFVTPEQISVVDILLSPKLGEKDSEKKAADILARINAGKDRNPHALAPDDSFTVQDRSLDKDKEPELYAAARKLKEGELSGVVKTGDGVHLLQLTRYTPGEQEPFDAVKDFIRKRLTTAALAKRFRSGSRN